MFEAKPWDLRNMPAGIFPAHRCMGWPKMRKLMPAARRCAAADSPYGPAPTMATSTASLMLVPPPCWPAAAVAAGPRLALFPVLLVLLVWLVLLVLVWRSRLGRLGRGRSGF